MFRRLLTWVAVLFGGFLALGAVVSAFSGPPKPKTADDLASDAETAKVEASKREARDLAERGKANEDRQKDARLTALAESQVAIKRALRDPDSLAWDKALVSADGSVVCLVYRAKNGFGGTNQEVSVLAQNKYRNTIQAWNKYCRSGDLIDMHARLF